MKSLVSYVMTGASIFGIFDNRRYRRSIGRLLRVGSMEYLCPAGMLWSRMQVAEMEGDVCVIYLGI